MAATPSVMMPLGTKAPDFTLPDTISGKQLSLESLKSDKATVVMFLCNHCPYVLAVLDRMIFETALHQLGVIGIILDEENKGTVGSVTDHWARSSLNHSRPPKLRNFGSPADV